MTGVVVLTPICILLGVKAAQIWIKSRGYLAQRLSLWIYGLVALLGLGLGLGFETCLQGPSWLAALLAGILAFLTYTDMKTGKLPDIGNITLFGFAVLSLMLAGLITWPFAVAGAVVGFLSLYLVNRLYRRKSSGRDGIGQGDMKLMAVAGGLVGPVGVFHVLFIGSAVSLLALKLRSQISSDNDIQKIPFGPGLCLGILMIWLYGWMKAQNGI